MKSLAKLGPALVLLLSVSAHARVGEDLGQCEARYGPSKTIEVPSELAQAGVSAYEFRREPYTIVALIGNSQGGMQISYFKEGRFSEVEATDLMKRNWSGPVEIESLWSMPNAGAGPRISWWVGPAGDASALDAILTTGSSHSELALISTLKMVKQSKSAISDYAEDFFVKYLQMLDADAKSSASGAITEQNEGL